jgi:hypothetical protein
MQPPIETATDSATNPVIRIRVSDPSSEKVVVEQPTTAG